MEISGGFKKNIHIVFKESAIVGASWLFGFEHLDVGF